jgi:hypothetical protein
VACVVSSPSCQPRSDNSTGKDDAEIDVYHVLSAIHVPTLVLGRLEDVDFPIQEVRETAMEIPGSKLIELPGSDHFFFVGDQDAVLREVGRFLDEVRNEQVELDRVLATVMFTDIVGSTEMAERQGDRRWREVLDIHHRRIRA